MLGGEIAGVGLQTRLRDPFKELADRCRFDPSTVLVREIGDGGRNQPKAPERPAERRRPPFEKSGEAILDRKRSIEVERNDRNVRSAAILYHFGAFPIWKDEAPTVPVSRRTL